MVFSQKALEDLRKGHLSISGKWEKLAERYCLYDFKDARAKEFATQGFLRRLKTLARCIDNAFSILPPYRNELPNSEELTDAAINIQAFVFNVFGSADNLAWVWVCEKNLKTERGLPFPRQWVSLSKESGAIRSSFSPEFRAYLDGLKDWFSNLEDFRHALAHRIPLYIPPYVVPSSKLVAYEELEDRMGKAIKRRDFMEHERLSAEQKGLAAFMPYITHSFVDKAQPVVFHAQLLADFNTIETLGRKMLEELDRE